MVIDRKMFLIFIFKPFQDHLIKTMLSLEDTYFSMAEKWNVEGGEQNCLVICDRGSS